MHRSTTRLLNCLPLGLAMVFLLPVELGCDLVKKAPGVGNVEVPELPDGGEGSYSGGDQPPGEGDGGEGPIESGGDDGNHSGGDDGQPGDESCDQQFALCLAEGNFEPLCEKLLDVCLHGGYEGGDEGGHDDGGESGHGESGHDDGGESGHDDGGDSGPHPGDDGGEWGDGGGNDEGMGEEGYPDEGGDVPLPGGCELAFEQCLAEGHSQAHCKEQFLDCIHNGG